MKCKHCNELIYVPLVGPAELCPCALDESQPVVPYVRMKDAIMDLRYCLVQMASDQFYTVAYRIPKDAEPNVADSIRQHAKLIRTTTKNISNLIDQLENQ